MITNLSPVCLLHKDFLLCKLHVQNDGDVKIVVSNSFDDIVLDETKDVLLEVRVLFGALTTHVKTFASHLYCHLNGKSC